jgi:hypothetical protein
MGHSLFVNPSDCSPRADQLVFLRSFERTAQTAKKYILMGISALLHCAVRPSAPQRARDSADDSVTKTNVGSLQNVLFGIPLVPRLYGYRCRARQNR